MDNKVKQLEDVLFNAVVNELLENPTAGWAQVARGLLSDYRELEQNLPSENLIKIREALKEAAPFKS